MQKIQPFHLAIPVSDLEEARIFYRDTLGCTEGRSSTHWVDFDFFGHQLVIHTRKTDAPSDHGGAAVDGKEVPIPHFGVVLDWETFETFSNRLKQQKISFQIEPHLRFEGQPGEQMTMFFKDPSGNALEFKAFRNIQQLFAK